MKHFIDWLYSTWYGGYITGCAIGFVGGVLL